MNTIDDFVALVREEIGLPLELADLDRHFDELPGWDSVHLLQLLTVLEKKTGRRISLPAVLESSSLENIYALAAG